MKALHPSAPLLCLLPGLALVPVAVVTLQGLHGGYGSYRKQVPAILPGVPGLDWRA